LNLTSLRPIPYFTLDNPCILPAITLILSPKFFFPNHQITDIPLSNFRQYNPDSIMVKNVFEK